MVSSLCILGGVGMRFYTFKLPKFIGGFVRIVLNTFNKK
ncbi:stage V sporulation protein SpoVM [Chengkuizengella sp. SCS-71B]